MRGIEREPWLLIILVALIAVLVGCHTVVNDFKPNTVESTGLIVIARGSIRDKTYCIVYDPDTGVEYYWGADTYLIPLYNADGSLKTYEQVPR